MWQNKRSDTQEILDLGPQYYSQNEYGRCLSLLNRINWILGGFKATQRALKGLSKTPDSVLEVGCGGGYLCRRLHHWLPKSKIVGIDISQQAIDHAKKYLPQQYRGKISFQAQKSKTLDYPDNHFDIVTTMLVCHHMTDDEMVAFLKESYRVCSQAVIMNDLHRHILAYLSFSLVTPILFPSRLIWNDGRLSVRRSFRKNDWFTLLEKAGFKKNQFTLKWHWAFRWTLTITK